jgi:hypothetical protein
VRQDDRFAALKEVEDAVIDPLQGGAKFVNPIPQKVGFGAAQFVAHLSQPLDPGDTLGARFVWDSVEPVQQWHAAVAFAVKDSFRSGHRSAIIIAILRKMSNGQMEAGPIAA